MMGRPRGSLNIGTTLWQEAFDHMTPEAAYWVGFLMADGCVNYPAGGRTPRVSLLLARKDEGHIRKFAEFLRTNKKLQLTDTHCGIQVVSQRLVDALAGYGVLPRKSHTARVVGLDRSIDFWRGVIDGDGSLLETDGVPKLYLVGSRSLLEQWVEFIGFGSICKHGSIFRVNITSGRATQWMRALYGHGGVSLDRKQSKAESFFCWSRKAAA